MIAPLMKQAGRFSETTVDGEVVLLNLDDGAFFSLTGTAAEIWALIDGARNREAVIAELAARHNADHAAVAADLDPFLADLQARGFLAGA
ncbi:PqqD family protein [Novosphingobium sp. NPDC080210]|uniref:PqqD family protein n=1 Tax=Novosphingobium sp. NPDC080210 TaxID=3390596 RepID=UPI003D07ED1D